MANVNLLINQGTQSPIPANLVGTANYPVVKIDVGASGSSVPWQGTVTVGTNALTVGTINSGTIGVLSLGTVDAVSALPINVWGTTVNIGTSTIGTLKAAVGGSSIYITDLIVSAGTQTTFALHNGGTANPIFGTVSFAQYGGVTSNFRTPLFGSSGSAITYIQSANGTMSITASGFVK